MTKREFFGLEFFKIFNLDGSISYRCKRQNVHTFSSLQIISYLYSSELDNLLLEINNALNGQYFEQYFTSDGVESESIEILPPNIIINELCTISLLDMKGLLEEWRDFRRI